MSGAISEAHIPDMKTNVAPMSGKILQNSIHDREYCASEDRPLIHEIREHA